MKHLYCKEGNNLFALYVMPRPKSKIKYIKQKLRQPQVVIFVVLLLAITVGTIGYMQAFSRLRNISYGLAMGGSLSTMSHNQRVAALGKIKALGFNEVRYNLSWSAIEPNTPTAPDWAASDSLVQDVKASGLKSIIILDRTPLWARPASCHSSDLCAPANPSDFAQFAADAAHRYHAYNVAAWEIWNEPNIVNFWEPAPNPDQYAKLLAASYGAIRLQDHSTPVLIGGLAGNADNSGSGYIDGRTFLTRLYADGAKHYFNGVSYHPYTSLRLPETPAPHNGWLKMYKTTPNIRGIMTANGDSAKDVWITEIGAPTGGPGGLVTNGSLTQLPPGSDHITLDLQTQIASQTLHDAQRLTWVKDFDWYTYQDNGSGAGPAGSFYGLLQFNGRPKPSYYVFQHLFSSR